MINEKEVIFNVLNGRNGVREEDANNVSVVIDQLGLKVHKTNPYFQIYNDIVLYLKDASGNIMALHKDDNYFKLSGNYMNNPYGFYISFQFGKITLCYPYDTISVLSVEHDGDKLNVFNHTEANLSDVLDNQKAMEPSSVINLDGFSKDMQISEILKFVKDFKFHDTINKETIYLHNAINLALSFVRYRNVDEKCKENIKNLLISLIEKYDLAVSGVGVLGGSVIMFHQKDTKDMYLNIYIDGVGQRSSVSDFTYVFEIKDNNDNQVVLYKFLLDRPKKREISTSIPGKYYDTNSSFIYYDEESIEFMCRRNIKIGDMTPNATFDYNDIAGIYEDVLERRKIE